jgi:hypothetical protein
MCDASDHLADNIDVSTLLEGTPEFSDRYLELVELADGYPGAQEVFSELAEFVAELAQGIDRFRPVLARCLAAVERVSEESDDAEELVGWCFLDYLPTETRQAVHQFLGPETREILELIENPTA